MINAQIAQRIKLKCKQKNVSVNQLTKDCGLGKSLIYDMETKNSSPSIEKIMRISEYLDCPVNYLLGITEISELNNSNNTTGDVNVGNHNVLIKGDAKNNNINSHASFEADEMTAELIKRFQSLSFDEKIEVFNYIKNIK